MKFSYSRLKLFEQCPYRFFKKYIEGFEEPVTLPLALGKAVHKAIEDRIKGLPIETAILNGRIETDFFPMDQNEILKLVSRATLPDENDVYTEYYFEIPLNPNISNSPVLRGYIDVVAKDGRYINDWKTNRKQYHVCDNEQIGLYAWAVQQLFGVNEVIGTLSFLRFNRKSTYIFRTSDMELMRQWALNLAEIILAKVALYEIVGDANVFPAKPSSNCKHCPFSVDCLKNACKQGSVKY